ncbi:ABC transporter permease [Candidatus Woesearchaeota archaeon]|nr:ABC transporter permease [Candidatus Woesearchaeota archaeon]
MTSLDKLQDFFIISLKGIAKRRLRSWLTMIGIFIGIAAVVALVSLGEGLQGAINAEFEEIGMDKIFVSPAGSLFGVGGTDSLTEDDIEVIRRVRDVDSITSYLFTTAQVSWDDEVWWHIVMGLSTDDEEMELMDEMFSLEKGRWFRDGEKYKAIVGYDYATHPAFDDKLLLEDDFEINGQEFEVIGSFEKIGNSQDDRTVAIPREVARDLLGIPERLDSIMVKVKQGADPNAVAAAIEEEMLDDRDLNEGEEDFTVQTFQDLIKSFLVILDIVTAVLVGIAAISLVIGAIGIMNTMYTSVLERTREIGIMKAVGAKNSDVLTLFLIESGLLGVAGGIIGILLGAGLASLAAYLAQTVGGFKYLEAQFPFWLILGSLAFSFLVGVAAGVLPARQASRKNPVDSLRYE